MQLQIIARIHTDFPDKFGVPRQSGIVPELTGRIVFEPAWRSADAVRGLEAFSHIWILWQFEVGERKCPHATVRPPRLGGNLRMGVFATRSPFRPNPVGLSSVRLLRIEYTKKEGPVLYVSGIDMRDNTPVYDIKPYLPYTDSHPEAREGFAAQNKEKRLAVEFPQALLEQVAPEKRQALLEVLAQDPRPSYQADPTRVYGMTFGGLNIRFTVDQTMLTVVAVESSSCPGDHRRLNTHADP